MRHKNKTKKLGRERGVRAGLMKALAYSLIKAGKIKTTDAKARALRPQIEKMITTAKIGTLASRRLLVSRIGNEAAGILVKEVAPKFSDRSGGYTRTTKLPARKSDGSLMAVIEFVQ